MATRIGPKTKKARRAGIRLQPKDDKIMTKRGYAPGMHGQSRRRISGYGQQLLEKQKAKWMYGIFERQFLKYYKKAAQTRGETGKLLLSILEKRLDNTVYRLGFASTRPQARQIVSHGFIEINGKKVNIPSYEVKIGEVITIRKSKQQSKLIQERKILLAKYKAPSWLHLDTGALTGKIVDEPDITETEQSISPQLIIEHYSR